MPPAHPLTFLCPSIKLIDSKYSLLLWPLTFPSLEEQDDTLEHGVCFITKLQFHKPLHLSFQTSPHFVFMSVSKESIQTLICDFACRNDSIKKKRKSSCCICVMIAFKWTPYKSMTASFVNNVPRGFWCKRVVLMVVCFFFLSLFMVLCYSPVQYFQL